MLADVRWDLTRRLNGYYKLPNGTSAQSGLTTKQFTYPVQTDSAFKNYEF